MYVKIKMNFLMEQNNVKIAMKVVLFVMVLQKMIVDSVNKVCIHKMDNVFKLVNQVCLQIN